MRRVAPPAVIALSVAPKREFFFGKRKHRFTTPAERTYAIFTAREEAVRNACPGYTFRIHQCDHSLIAKADANVRLVLEQEKKAAAAASIAK